MSESNVTRLKLLLKVYLSYFVLTGARSVCTVSHACQLGGSKHLLGSSWEQILSLFANGVAVWLLHILIVARSERLGQTSTVCCTFHRVWEVLQAPLPTAGRCPGKLLLPASMTLVMATLGSCHHHLGWPKSPTCVQLRGTWAAPMHSLADRGCVGSADPGLAEGLYSSVALSSSTKVFHGSDCLFPSFQILQAKLQAEKHHGGWQPEICSPWEGS